MPARQPFTHLCQLLASPRHAGRVDLHMHTIHSDGTYTPAEIVELGRRCGLSALAITDHDTLAALPEAERANRDPGPGSPLEIIPGVEITTAFQDREIHLLAYFIDPYHEPLRQLLEEIRVGRTERFREMVARLEKRGLNLDDALVGPLDAGPALGRRHLAELLVRTGHVRTSREAFMRYLGEKGGILVPKRLHPVGKVMPLVRAAGGVASWAHPGQACSLQTLRELRALGMEAVEVEYPDLRRSRVQQLRTWAREADLAITGGSDCHGPGRRSVGSCGISAEELSVLRQRRPGRIVHPTPLPIATLSSAGSS